MKRRTLLALAATSIVPGISTSAQVTPNQPTAEPPSTSDPALLLIQGIGWSSFLETDRVQKVQPVDGGRFLVFFFEPEDGLILELAQHVQKNDVFMTGRSGIQPGEDYLDTQRHIQTWKTIRSRFRTPVVAVDEAGAPLEFLSYEHSWVVLFFEDKQSAEYFEVWSLPNDSTVLLHMGESFLEEFNPSLGNLMYLRSALAFDDVTFPESPVPFPNLSN